MGITGIDVADSVVEIGTFKTRSAPKEETHMLWTIFVILLILWLLGVVSGYAIGGFIHILLVIALVVLLINIISGRRTVV